MAPVISPPEKSRQILPHCLPGSLVGKVSRRTGRAIRTFLGCYGHSAKTALTQTTFQALAPAGFQRSHQLPCMAHYGLPRQAMHRGARWNGPRAAMPRRFALRVAHTDWREVPVQSESARTPRMPAWSALPSQEPCRCGPALRVPYGTLPLPQGEDGVRFHCARVPRLGDATAPRMQPTLGGTATTVLFGANPIALPTKERGNPIRCQDDLLC